MFCGPSRRVPAVPTLHFHFGVPILILTLAVPLEALGLLVEGAIGDLRPLIVLPLPPARVTQCLGHAYIRTSHLQSVGKLLPVGSMYSMKAGRPNRDWTERGLSLPLAPVPCSFPYFFRMYDKDVFRLTDDKLHHGGGGDRGRHWNIRKWRRRALPHSI